MSDLAQGENSKQKEITAVITGFAPWKPGQINPSFLVCDALPISIDRPGKTPIRIIKYPHPIKTAYRTVQKLVPELWDGRRGSYDPAILPTPNPVLEASEDRFSIDIMLHIGMLPPGMLAYSIEKNGGRDGYLHHPDVDGEIPEVDRKGVVIGWERYPRTLETEFDVTELLKSCRHELPVLRYPKDVPICVSFNAGTFLCSFIYYSSLVELLIREEEKRVLFLHIPAAASEADVQQGVRVVIALISAIADQKSEILKV
ncbi:MAG: hypothetical protein M1840_009131 [Geoglossum simile]|nr:MAG: hypothetical protein M1840_009131 [Geoglossum simile]